MELTAQAAIFFFILVERDNYATHVPTIDAPIWIDNLFSGLSDWQAEQVYQSLSEIACHGDHAEPCDPEHRTWHLLRWLQGFGNLAAVDEAMKNGATGVENACILAQTTQIEALHCRALQAARSAYEAQKDEVDELAKLIGE